MSVEHDGGPGREEERLNSIEAKLLKEGLLKSARHAGAPDPKHIVDQFLPMAKFVNGQILISFQGEKLTVRKLISKLTDQPSHGAPT